MIVCTACGNHNNDDDEFCGSCGKFLEWVGERVEVTQPEPEPEPVVADEPAKLGIIGRVKAAVGIDDRSAAAEGETDTVATDSAAAVATAAPAAGGPLAGAPVVAAASAATPTLSDAAEAAPDATAPEDEARRQAEAAQEAEAARQAEEEAARQAEEEAARRATEEEAARKAADAEAAHQAAEAEAAARRSAEEQAAQQALEAEVARRQADADAKAREEAAQRAAALLARPKSVEEVAEEAPPAEPVEPASGQQPAAMKPVAQQPSKMKAPPRPAPKQVTVEERPSAGDLICSQCGTGNDPARKFCRKCGNSLAQAVVAAKLPWWKRIFGGRKAKGKVSAGAGTGEARTLGSTKAKGRAATAGVREASFKTQMAFATVKRVVVFLAMLGIAVPLVAFPGLRENIGNKASDAVNNVQDFINPKTSPVNATAVVATSEVPTHEAGQVSDLGSNTFWAAAPADNDGIGQGVTFTFDGKVELKKLIIRSGAADSPDNFVNQPRPHEIRLAYDNNNSQTITLKDDIAPQSFTVKGGKNVGQVQLSVVSVYKGRAGHSVSIAEVEFRKKG